MRRIMVGGISGAGKSTLARTLARRLDLPYVEFDALFHGPGWTPRKSFAADVDAFTSTDAWVTDSDGYERFIGSRVRDRADTWVWLDYPRWVCEWRVLRRSVVRGLLRRKLWNGNRESLLNIVRDPEHPVRWAWTQHAARRARGEQLMRDPACAHLRVVRLRRPRDTRRWLREIEGA
ncbi:MAG: adenylate kinase [Frankiales bacterium]|nr:adenylate kinase [Frankiales bacterium]